MEEDWWGEDRAGGVEEDFWGDGDGRSGGVEESFDGHSMRPYSSTSTWLNALIMFVGRKIKTIMILTLLYNFQSHE